MDKKKSIEIAAELLKDMHGYVNGNHSNVSFDFIVEDGGEGIEVFSTRHESPVFYWPEDVCKLAEALQLSVFIDLRKIPFGTDKYGKEILQETIVLYIH